MQDKFVMGFTYVRIPYRTANQGKGESHSKNGTRTYDA